MCFKEYLEQSSLKSLVLTYASLGSCNCNISLYQLQTVEHINFSSLQEKKSVVLFDFFFFLIYLFCNVQHIGEKSDVKKLDQKVCL